MVLVAKKLSLFIMALSLVGCVESAKRAIDTEQEKPGDNTTTLGAAGGGSGFAGAAPDFGGGYPYGDEPELPALDDPLNGGGSSEPTPIDVPATDSPTDTGGLPNDDTVIGGPIDTGSNNSPANPSTGLDNPSSGNSGLGSNSGADSLPPAPIDAGPVQQQQPVSLTLAPILPRLAPASGAQDINNNGATSLPAPPSDNGAASLPAPPIDDGPSGLPAPPVDNKPEVNPYTFDEFCQTFGDACSDGGVWVL